MARKVDDLGRIVLPVELRRLHGIQTGDALEISVDGDAIVLRKLLQGCVFCGANVELHVYRDRAICSTCREGVTSSGAGAGTGANAGAGIGVARAPSAMSSA